MCFMTFAKELDWFFLFLWSSDWRQTRWWYRQKRTTEISCLRTKFQQFFFLLKYFIFRVVIKHAFPLSLTFFCMNTYQIIAFIAQKSIFSMLSLFKMLSLSYYLLLHLTLDFQPKKWLMLCDFNEFIFLLKFNFFRNSKASMPSINQIFTFTNYWNCSK